MGCHVFRGFRRYKHRQSGGDQGCRCSNERSCKCNISRLRLLRVPCQGSAVTRVLLALSFTVNSLYIWWTRGVFSRISERIDPKIVINIQYFRISQHCRINYFVIRLMGSGNSLLWTYNHQFSIHITGHLTLNIENEDYQKVHSIQAI